MKIHGIFFTKTENSTQSQPLSTEPTAVISGGEFSEGEGIELERATTSPDDDKKTYTKTREDDCGNTIIETYNATDNTLISRKTKFFDTEIIEYYRPGTNIISRKERISNDRKTITEYYATAPYKAQSEIVHYNDGTLGDQEYYRNDENNSIEKRISYRYGQKTERTYDENSKILTIKEFDKDNKIVEETIWNQEEYTYHQTIYRSDGSIYEESEFDNIKNPNYTSIISYSRDGRITQRLSFDRENGYYINKNYDSDGSVFCEENLDLDQRLRKRTIYNTDGSIYLFVEYDNKGKIVNYEKYTNKDNVHHDKFDPRLLDGNIDKNFTQGYTGICYLAATVRGMLETEQGKLLLNETVVNYDEETSTHNITLPGANKVYQFSKEETIKAMGRIGTTDPDFTAFALAWEQYITETESRSSDFGHTTGVMKALTGKNTQSNFMGGFCVGIDNNDINRFERLIADKKAFITVSTPPESVYTEPTIEERRKGIKNNHLYTVLAIDENNITLFDPTSGEKTFTREEFIENFYGYEIFEFEE